MFQSTPKREPCEPEEREAAIQATETTQLLPSSVDIEAHTQQPSSWLATVSSELKGIAKHAWPVSLATVFRLLVFATDTAFIGQLGTKQLAGAALAQVRMASSTCVMHVL